MATLLIYVDSSTKGTGGTRWGESVAAWAAWWKGTTSQKPARGGVHYFRHSGPNVTFYEGIIRALESCLGFIYNGPDDPDDVAVFGDCSPVIAQLRGERQVGQMAKYHRQVMALARKYRGSLSFGHMNEKDPDYKKVDQASKRARGWFGQIY